MIEDKFGELAGADPVKKALGKARRALKPNRFDKDKALNEYAKAVEEFAEQTEWRAAAAPLLGDVTAYADAIRDTVGILDAIANPVTDCNAVGNAVVCATCTSRRYGPHSPAAVCVAVPRVGPN